MGDYNDTSNINQALLLYENLTDQVSALLQLYQGKTNQAQWVDITSQESRFLPKIEQEQNNTYYESSTTLYESTPANLNAPFICAANFSQSAMGALFYSLNTGISPNAGIVEVTYNVSTSGPGLFSRMNPASSCP